MIKEHDRVVLTADLANERLKAGDVGTVVHIHRNGEAYEVEFMTLNGETVGSRTLLSPQMRPIEPREITHARSLVDALKLGFKSPSKAFSGRWPDSSPRSTP
jgi:hypothetical protein